MRRTLIRTLWAPLLIIGAMCFGPAQADEVTLAQFKGYTAINRILEERLARDGQGFGLAAYLDETYGAFGGGLLDLLGSYGDATLDSAFRNGQANVVNLVLWHVAFSGLSQDLAGLCNPTVYDPLAAITQESFMAALTPICAWPAATAQTDDAMLGFWLALMSFDAPMTEYLAWRDFFRSPAYAASDAAETIAAMSLAAFNNPHFLLRK